MNPAPPPLSQTRRVRCHVHPLFGAHDPGSHPESPARYAAALAAVRARPERALEVVATAAPREAVDAVHDPRFVDALQRFCRQGGGSIDSDTAVSADSFEAALRASGAAIAAVADALAGGPGFAFGRPPGHHAERARAMGFCLINHVAVAAADARRRGLERLAVVDWDAHHGNGTQALFWDDPNVLYASIHQFGSGFYPGTGDHRERGGDAALGATLNVPLAAGTSAADHLAAFREVIVPAVAAFRPGVIVVSAGFDAHRDDPLCSLALTEPDFAAMATDLLELGPVAFVLEGGYDLDALRGGVGAVLDAATA